MAPDFSSLRAVVPDRLQSALKWFRIAAYVTGILLLLLTIEMVAKYGFGSEVELGGTGGFLAMVPDGSVRLS